MWRLTGFLFCASPFINPPLDHSLSVLSRPRCDGDESVCSSRAAGGDYGDPADRSEGPGTGTQIAAAASPPSALSSPETPLMIPAATAVVCLIPPRPSRSSRVPPGRGGGRQSGGGGLLHMDRDRMGARPEHHLLSQTCHPTDSPNPFDLS